MFILLHLATYFTCLPAVKVLWTALVLCVCCCGIACRQDKQRLSACQRRKGGLLLYFNTFVYICSYISIYIYTTNKPIKLLFVCALFAHKSRNGCEHESPASRTFLLAWQGYLMLTRNIWLCLIRGNWRCCHLHTHLSPHTYIMYVCIVYLHTNIPTWQLVWKKCIVYKYTCEKTQRLLTLPWLFFVSAAIKLNIVSFKLKLFTFTSAYYLIWLSV